VNEHRQPHRRRDRREGGYSNNPNDSGGETMWGVTDRVARANGYAGPMKDMPREVAKNIYFASYVQKPGFASIMPLSERDRRGVGRHWRQHGAAVPR
jgi:lysozyme family protein